MANYYIGADVDSKMTERMLKKKIISHLQNIARLILEFPISRLYFAVAHHRLLKRYTGRVGWFRIAIDEPVSGH